MNKIVIFLTIILLGCQPKEKKKTDQRPNILWIMMENWNTDLSCYGSPIVQTPNIDELASQGMICTNAFCTSPVCSPSRSAMMTGFQQVYIGAHQHRTSGPGFEKEKLPYGIKPIPHLLKEAGYYTCLMNSAKTDCNFITEEPLFEGRDWSERKDGQPFFAQATFQETDLGYGSKRDTINPVDTEGIEIPPFYPDNNYSRRVYANGFESVQNCDREIGKLLKRLDDEGLSDNTIIFLISDNGICLPRGIQFMYEDGIHIPLIVKWPDKIKPGTINDDLLMTIDISATILDIAEIEPGYELHGKNILSEEVKNRKYIYASRDKMDWTFDAMRMIRSKKFKLIHNLMPERAYCQFNEYKETKFPLMALLNMMHLKGKLTPEQAKFMAEEKPEIELYNLENDPYELYNLAYDPAYSGIREELLEKLVKWRESVNDPGVSEAFRNGGWPSKYPTRSLQEWTTIAESWEDWLLYNGKYPSIDYIPEAEPVNLR